MFKANSPKKFQARRMRERVGQIERQDALVSKASADPPVVATDGGGYKEHWNLSYAGRGFIIQAAAKKRTFVLQEHILFAARLNA